MLRFMVHPTTIRSASDGDVHYINAGMLMKLYGIQNEPNVRIARTREAERLIYAKTVTEYNDYIHLWPREDGDYSRFWEKDK